MKPKARILTTLQRQPSDPTPLDLWPTPEIGAALRQRFGAKNAPGASSGLGGMTRRRCLGLTALASLTGAFLPWHAWAGRAARAREYQLCLNPQAVLQDPDFPALVARAGVSCVLGIMAMYLGADKAGIRLADYRGVPLRVGELMFDDQAFSPVKGKTDDLFSVLFHRRLAAPESAWSETTAYPADKLSAMHLAAKLVMSTVAGVRHTMFMSGITPFPKTHWATPHCEVIRPMACSAGTVFSTLR